MVISNRELGIGGKMSEIIASESTSYDLNEVVASLNKLLKLRTIPIGMKMFESIEEMESIPKIRRPSAIHTTDQIVGQASRNGWTVGITVEDLALETINGFQVIAWLEFGLVILMVLVLIRSPWML